jgi:lipopolysaccharide export system protein LptA
MIKWVVALWFSLCAMAFAQSKPLLMEHADSLSVERGRGFLLLRGDVRFRHDSVQVRTERAMWNKNADVVHCEGGFLFLHPKGSMKANAGEYRRKSEIAEGIGSIVARDSNGEAAYFGERAIYNRKTEFLDLISAPVVHRYTKDTVKHKTDTLIIRARHIIYDRKRDLASAFGNVRITQGDLVVTCDTGWFDKKNNKLSLVGKPKCQLKDNQLSGDSMHIVLAGDKLKTVRVVKNALGVQDETPKNGDPLKHTQVTGDTLFAEFDGDKMKSIYVTVGAEGKFWEEDLKNYVNKMTGQTLALAFQDGQMQNARVLGSAKSTYWYTDKKRVISGRNEALGDTIFVTFDSSKVKRLRINGNMATGVFYDLSKKGLADKKTVKEGKK